MQAVHGSAMHVHPSRGGQRRCDLPVVLASSESSRVDVLWKTASPAVRMNTPDTTFDGPLGPGADGNAAGLTAGAGVWPAAQVAMKVTNMW